MATLDIVNVINVSVSEAPIGLSDYKVNNVALFTNETPVDGAQAFGSKRIYVSPQAVGEDFGTTSEAYLQAVALFSQNPNILTGGGVLIIFLIGAQETLLQAITRAAALEYFVGILSVAYPSTDETILALANGVQAMKDKILFLASETEADIAGVFTDIMEASDSHCRCLYYGGTAQEARLFAAAACGRGMGVNFDGSNTTNTLHMKSLATITPDDTVDQTLLSDLEDAGVDAYVDVAGIPMYWSNGANRYFDEVFNLIWFVAQLKVNGFNALRELSTKIPQTEPGMNMLKGAYRLACVQAVANGMVAPGSWTSPEWFGDPQDMYNNIQERGYYLYSQPVALQSAADRADRKAPITQIAVKLAGAIHSSDVIVNFNR